MCNSDWRRGWRRVDKQSNALRILVLSISLLACSSSNDGSQSGSRYPGAQGDKDADTGDIPNNPLGKPDSGTASNQDSGIVVSGPLGIEPKDPVIHVVNGKAQTIDFIAKQGTVERKAVWSLSRAEIGSIDASSGQFTTAGVGGTAVITADVGSKQASTTVTVMIEATQNGAKQSDSCAAGGCGGVGGEGAGPKITASQQTTLDASPTSDKSLQLLYPYDGTVWPLDLLAPLLQWDIDPSTSVDAIKIDISGKYYNYVGYFSRPTLLAAGDPFVRHPIPQAVWDAATHSATHDSLKVTLTLLANDTALGPLETTWIIAGGSLKGVVYYQSYGTKLASNYSGAIDPSAPGGLSDFGGATLAISGNSTSPTLVAGSDGDHHQCRVCHTVSADGSRMVVQHGDNYPASSSYALTQPAYPETPYPTDGLMGWVGLYPDGSIGLSNGGPISGGANTMPSNLVDATAGAVIPSNGLTNFVTLAALPAFSPDGSQVAFAFYEGPGDSQVGAGDPSKLVLMDFDVTSSTFSNPQLVFQAMGGALPGWPSFTPSGNRLVFQLDLPSGQNRGEYFATRYGNRGELWWVDLSTGNAHPLERLNGTQGGTSYLPVLPNNHDHDEQLAYEPTVSPIASGGYAWVVFTSRRAYGNVASIDPTWSDPRDHDLTQTPTPKKLWVAALDLPSDVEIQATTDDPSHPAFYLPAQELLAGNSRGYWVPEPCRENGSDCDSGDQCCDGFCAYDGVAMKNLCGGTPPECSNEFDICTVSDDCCDDTLQCIGGRCSMVILN